MDTTGMCEMISIEQSITVKMAKGEEITAAGGRTSTISDGTYEIPCLKIEPVSVTAENMDEVIIKSGFHLKEDVYLNVHDKTEED